MDAKSGKSLFVTGMSSGIDLHFGKNPQVMDEQITPGRNIQSTAPAG